MNVLILGSGGREHALARACARSPQIGKLLVAPGNPGCATVAAVCDANLADHSQILALCKREGIDLVVVGPEAPLVAGIADDLEKEGVAGALVRPVLPHASRARRALPRTSAASLAFRLPSTVAFRRPMMPKPIFAAAARRLS